MKTNSLKEKIEIGSLTKKEIHCSKCQKTGTLENFVVLRNNKGQDVYLCPECKEKMNQEFEKETQNPNYLLAVILGIVGAILGGLAWYYVAIFTLRELGYISIGLGYLVGWGVYFGAGKKRGLNLQIITVIIVIIAIFITKKFLFDYLVLDYLQKSGEIAKDEIIKISIFDEYFLKDLFTPIGLLIYAIGIYFGFMVCKPRKI